MGVMGKMKVIDFGVDGFPSNSLNLESYEVVGKRWEEDVEKKAMAIKTEKRASASSSSSSTLSSLELLADVATQQSKELLLDEKTIVEELINFFARKGREQRVLADKQGFELNDIFIPKKKRSRLGPVSLNMKTLKRKRECTADPNTYESGSQKKKKEEGVHVQNWAKKRECSTGATANKDCNYIENRSSPSPSFRGYSKIAKANNWSFRVSDVSKLRFVIVKLNSTSTKEEPYQHLGSTSSATSALTHQ